MRGLGYWGQIPHFSKCFLNLEKEGGMFSNPCSLLVVYKNTGSHKNHGTNEMTFGNYPLSSYRHIRIYCLSNSKTFQDGNGNGNLGEICSNDFQDGNWESMEMKV